MKGLLICPDVQEVYPIDVDNDNTLSSLYKHMKCEVIERVLLDFNNDLILDEAGKLLYPNRFGYFVLAGTADPIFAGYAVVLGSNEDGSGWIDTTLTAEQLKAQILWTSPSEELAKPRATFVW